MELLKSNSNNITNGFGKGDRIVSSNIYTNNLNGNSTRKKTRCIANGERRVQKNSSLKDICIGTLYFPILELSYS